MSDHGGLDEILRTRTPPGAKVFRPRVVENLFKEPVYVTSERHHKELQKLAGATHIGSDGHKEAVEQARDRGADILRKVPEAEKNGEPVPKE